MTARVIRRFTHPVNHLPQEYVAEQISEVIAGLGDCPTCAGTGVVVVLMCMAGRPQTPVKDCPGCHGAKWKGRRPA